MAVVDGTDSNGHLIAGARWDFQKMTAPYGARTVWVNAVHWPGCEANANHGNVGFGVQRDDRFLRFNRPFWDALALDYEPVIAAAARIHATGDLGNIYADSGVGSEGSALA